MERQNLHGKDRYRAKFPRGGHRRKLRHSRDQGIRWTNSGSWTEPAGAISIMIRKGESGRAGIYDWWTCEFCSLVMGALLWIAVTGWKILWSQPVFFASQGNLIVKNTAFQVSYPGKYVLRSGQWYFSHRKGIYIFHMYMVTYMLWFITFPAIIYCTVLCARS